MDPGSSERHAAVSGRTTGFDGAWLPCGLLLADGPGSRRAAVGAGEVEDGVMRVGVAADSSPTSMGSGLVACPGFAEAPSAVGDGGAPFSAANNGRFGP